MTEPFPDTWQAPPPRIHTGRFVELSPTNAAADVAELYTIGHESEQALKLWDYLPCGPFGDPGAMRDWLYAWHCRPDVVAYTVRDFETRRCLGSLSIMRITPEHGVAELGFIWYAPAAQRTKVNTECVYLLLKHLFDDLKYRRVEWKCDNANARSKAAALRLGFQSEGLFRQHLIVKRHNRDTAWFAMVDKEWPQHKARLERWLYCNDGGSLSGG